MVKRYTVYQNGGIEESNDGDYVSHEDYAALLAKYEKAVSVIEDQCFSESRLTALIAQAALKELKGDVPTGTQDHGFPLHD